MPEEGYRSGALQESDSQLFTGSCREFCLISSRTFYGPVPEPSTEARQCLSLDPRGKLSLTVWGCADETGPGAELRREEETVPEPARALLTKVLGECFSRSLPRSQESELGDWELTLTNDRGQQYLFRGGLGIRLEQGDLELSDLLRRSLGRGDLLGFDGNPGPERILSVSMDCFRNREKMEPAAFLRLDRKAGSLTLGEALPGGGRAVHTYTLGDPLENFLDSLDPQTLFTRMPEAPEDLLEDPEEGGCYEMTVALRKAGLRTLSGSFDRYGLPEDYGRFACGLAVLIRSCGRMALLDPLVYGRSRRRQSDLILCSVAFPGSSSLYDYLSRENDLRPGDRVMVPAGYSNQPRLVTVRQIRYVSREDRGQLGSRLKYILKKVEDFK